MGRTLKDGSFKPKPSVQARIEFMQQEPQPLRSVTRGTEVYARMGAGWSKAYVVSWAKNCITVQLARDKKHVHVFDNRSIRLPGDPKW
ncbi:transcription elongation factor [Synechococcus phage S-CRES1]|nr:transcription elongation factor [Synechococcus phage S-CRES1]